MKKNVQQLICAENDCVGCNACALVCPCKCILIKQNSLFSENRVRNMESCISCQQCNKVCPQLSAPEMHVSYKCYAAWSFDNNTRVESASGGIASELYKAFAQNGYMFSGVNFDEDNKLKYFLSSNSADIPLFRNSKYVFSETANIYEEIKNALNRGEVVLFVGLPCHVAGLKKYLMLLKVDIIRLFTVDLVCHGTCHSSLLNEHIKTIEKRLHRKTKRLSFRNPIFGTNNFYFTLEDNDGIFYKKPADGNDEYQLGYHNGIIYRENCYNCHYAKKERQGDITLSDFSGVGKIRDYSHDKKSVSCILVNTEKGQRLIEMIIDTVYLEERPLEEEWNYEKQLSHPTERTNQHQQFVSEYQKTNDFQHSIRVVMRKKIWQNELISILKVKTIKKAIRKIIPDAFMRTIKNFRTKGE